MSSERCAATAGSAMPAPALEGKPAPVRLTIRDLEKTFTRRTGEEVRAIDHVSLNVAKGEFVVLLGPSGCGKSTLLRCVAGLETPSGGEIAIGERVVSSPRRGVHLAPEDRDISMMFQSYAVWPHMTVAQNVGYPLKVRGKPRADVKQAVAGMLRTVGLQGLADEYPGQLSGGQQQRVGLARCLVVGPEVVLFDEPLSNVDARVRRLLRRELVAMQREFGFAGVYVTHDQEEAMQIADRVVLMRNGRAEQVGAPSEIYARPESRYAASFLGEINEIPGVLMQNDRACQGKVRHALVKTEAGPLLEAELVGTAAPSDDVVIAIRPHHLGIARRNAEKEGEGLEGHIERQISVGTHIEFIVRIKCGTHVTIWSPTNRDDLRPGTDVLVTLHSDHVIAFPASDSIQ